jgi:DNA-binding GntR family transcriptional regulator
MKVPRLKRSSLRETVLKLIEDALLDGELQPGDRIIEAELAKQAGISRGPVREAIRQLVGEGILVSYPSKGTFVTRWTPQDVEEAYSLRAVLERFAAQRAVKRITSRDVAKLQGIVDKMEENAERDDVRALVRLDVQFHETLYALSGHSLLQKMLSKLRMRLHSLQATDPGFSLFRDQMASDHQPIVDALRTRDVNAAGDAVSTHVLSVGEVMAQQLEREARE